MTTEDLKPENVGRKVLIEAIGNFNDCRATFRAWQRNQTTIICSLDSSYGKDFQPGRLLEVPIANVRFATRDVSDDGRQWTPKKAA
jgi:hypothetical protein